MRMIIPYGHTPTVREDPIRHSISRPCSSGHMCRTGLKTYTGGSAQAAKFRTMTTLFNICKYRVLASILGIGGLSGLCRESISQTGIPETVLYGRGPESPICCGTVIATLRTGRGASRSKKKLSSIHSNECVWHAKASVHAMSSSYRVWLNVSRAARPLKSSYWTNCGYPSAKSARHKSFEFLSALHAP
jgi:hypothetical protein